MPDYEHVHRGRVSVGRARETETRESVNRDRPRTREPLNTNNEDDLTLEDGERGRAKKAI